MANPMVTSIWSWEPQKGPQDPKKGQKAPQHSAGALTCVNSSTGFVCCSYRISVCQDSNEATENWLLQYGQLCQSELCARLLYEVHPGPGSRPLPQQWWGDRCSLLIRRKRRVSRNISYLWFRPLFSDITRFSGSILFSTLCFTPPPLECPLFSCPRPLLIFTNISFPSSSIFVSITNGFGMTSGSKPWKGTSRHSKNF